MGVGHGRRDLLVTQPYSFGTLPSALSLPSGPIWNFTLPIPLGQHGWSLPFCHWYWTVIVSSEGARTVMYGFGFAVAVPNAMLWSKNSSC